MNNSNKYSNRLALTYLCNAVPHMDRRSKTAEELVKWVRDVSAWPRSEMPKVANKSSKISAMEWKQLLGFLRAQLSEIGRARPDSTAMHLNRLAKYLGLSRDDVSIVELVLRYATDPLIESMIEDVFDDWIVTRSLGSFRSINNPTMPRLLGIPPGRFSRRLASETTLMRSGILQINSDGELLVLDRLLRLAHRPFKASQNVPGLLFDVAPKAELEWQDYDHVAQSRDHIEQLIRGALESRASGVNILIYGPHGTGKTEFCRTLAQRLDVCLYGIGEPDEDGDIPSGKERFGELRLAQRVLGDGGNSILLFDEMDDLLCEGPSEMGEAFAPRHRTAQNSKVGMNRMLEDTRVPILWTTNSTYDVSPAILRRMMFAFELSKPSAKVRERIWARQLKRHDVSSTSDDANALARNYDVAPGVAAGATKAARLINGGDINTVRFGVHSLSKLVYGERPPQEDVKKIDPALISTDTDASALAERLAKLGLCRVSLCLQGPPGTGKSAFVRHLADRMGIEVAQKRASDLMSCWVGETEKIIAQAFAEAREQGHFLVFDEADSLLSDRRHAQRNWEVSQVNEMLTWMEHHPLPFACTTNYMDRLDSATLRRFDFKIALEYLSAEQAASAFRSFFQLEPPREIGNVSELTPGDFAVVKRRAELLGVLEDRDALLTMLKEECEAKPGCARRIGFAA